MSALFAFEALLGLLIIINAASYIFLTPQCSDAPIQPHPLYKKLARIAYSVATVLGIARLPYAIIPYACKVVIFLLAPAPVRELWRTSRLFQAARTLGDLANFVITSVLLMLAADFIAGGWLRQLFGLSIAAEASRLALEKGAMITSGIWQSIPHRTLAAWMAQSKSPRWLMAYRDYYCLSDEARIAAALEALQARAALDEVAARRVSYTTTLRIVPDNHPLETGHVRDVAKGEVFIHRRWTNDPWLLMGTALRRGAWLFDPRFLRRPFTYRTEMNPLATLFVLEHAVYSPPYALYQLGHQIKAARYEVFFGILRGLGVDFEKRLMANGVFPYEQTIEWIERRLGRPVENDLRPLWSDDEVIADASPELSAGEIAERYTYPLRYAIEVLLEKVRQAKTGIRQ